MFNFLPSVHAAKLSDAPLVQVLAQVRFNNQRVLANHSGASQFQEPLVDHYPRMLAETQSNITAAPGNVSSSSTPQWRLTDLEGAWSCIIGPEHMTIETSAYTTWPVLRDRLTEALNALSAVSAPRVRERVGLRYVNHIPRGDDSSYRGRVNEHLLGLMDAKGWNEQLKVTLSQMIIQDGATQLALRYGTAGVVSGPIPVDTFLIDIDCSDETPSPFDTEALIDYFDQLNDSALRCFFASLADPYRMSLMPQGDAE